MTWEEKKHSVLRTGGDVLEGDFYVRIDIKKIVR